MSVETRFLNKEEVVKCLSCLSCKGDTTVASGIVMAELCEEFTNVCREFYQGGNLPRKSVLPVYEGLCPTDNQLRRALEKLMALESSGGKRPRLFFTPRQWLSVYKVFQFLHYIGNGYGSFAQMERIVVRIYRGDSPRVPCRQDDIQKKNIGKPFNAPLAVWEEKKDETGMEPYWLIALHLLQFIKEECGSNGGFPDEVPK